MAQTQTLGGLEPQFREINLALIDKRQFVDVVSPASANAQFTVRHGLGRLPVGYLVIEQDKAGSIYKDTDGTSEDLFLKCSVTSMAVRLLVF